MKQENTNVDQSAHLKERWQKLLNQADVFQALHEGLDGGLKKQEPDWNKAIRDAHTMSEKAKVMDMRDRYKQEQQQLAYKVLAQEHDSKVEQVLALPVTKRNEAYYKKLPPAVLADKRVRQQMQADRQVMKLAFYLRGD